MMNQTNIELKQLSDEERVDILPSLKEIESKLLSTTEYFFKGNNSFDIPFRGFLLSGSPGTGKTELVRQLTRKLNNRIKNVYLLFVDGSMIASKGWGEAEKNLVNIFLLAQKQDNKKIVILLDDIESLFLSRGASLSKEWHYSINSVLFHQLDNINPNKTIVFATTNRLDLVDEAIQSRLYLVQFPDLTIEQLMDYFERKIRKLISESDYIIIKRIVEEKLLKKQEENHKLSIRDLENAIIISCIEAGVWRV